HEQAQDQAARGNAIRRRTRLWHDLPIAHFHFTRPSWLSQIEPQHQSEPRFEEIALRSQHNPARSTGKTPGTRLRDYFASAFWPAPAATLLQRAPWETES